jgi:hypothetical protein
MRDDAETTGVPLAAVMVPPVTDNAAVNVASLSIVPVDAAAKAKAGKTLLPTNEAEM